MADAKEKTERKEATNAYMGETPQHFVDYALSCVRTSIDSMREIRDLQDECWRVYQEEDPYNFAWKEDWQSKVTYPKPYKTIQGASAIIRKIFEMDFLTITKKGEQESANFWKDLLLILLDRNYANFPVRFADATTNALAIGQSLEMIPYWIPNDGLRFSLIEPNKVHRDPDALSRQPHSGDYWIHQENMGRHRLKALEKAGKYIKGSIDQIKSSGGGGMGARAISPETTPEEVARRKQMLYNRNRYIDPILVYDFWGDIVSDKGEMLMEDGHYALAESIIIEEPSFSPYPTLRWPGVGFSALPHMLRWDGRGLIQGIRSLWYLMCNLMSLHSDHLNWTVNPMIELDVNMLIDQDDTDIFPGKIYYTHTTQHGQKVVRPVDFRSEVGDIMAILNFFDQRAQDGGMIDYHTLGLPGWRAAVTKGEAAQNLEQSMILVGAMAKNVEDGALDAIMAAAETVMISMSYDELVELMGEEVARKYQVEVTEENPTGLVLPPLSRGAFHVTGISGSMKSQEALKNIETLILPMLNQQQYGNMFAPLPPDRKDYQDHRAAG